MKLQETYNRNKVFIIELKHRIETPKDEKIKHVYEWGVSKINKLEAEQAVSASPLTTFYLSESVDAKNSDIGDTIILASQANRMDTNVILQEVEKVEEYHTFTRVFDGRDSKKESIKGHIRLKKVFPNYEHKELETLFEIKKKEIQMGIIQNMSNSIKYPLIISAGQRTEVKRAIIIIFRLSDFGRSFQYPKYFHPYIKSIKGHFKGRSQAGPLCTT
jgi:hypothetical protein